MEDVIKLKAKIDASDIDASTKLLERLVGLLKEANSLINELASNELVLHIKV